MLFETLKNDLLIFFLSMLPVNELRGSILYGIHILKMSTFHAFFAGILGNIFPIIFLLKWLDPLTKWIFRHSLFIEKHAKRYFEKLHTKHSAKFNELGAVFLAVFVAIPIPGTGAWTGLLLAYLFNIPYWLALGSISLGVVGAGVIVTFFSETVKWLL